jgi:hypothetical protein
VAVEENETVEQARPSALGMRHVRVQVECVCACVCVCLYVCAQCV